jgi:hypothetical protein
MFRDYLEMLKVLATAAALGFILYAMAFLGLLYGLD